jgi:type IV secretion system protein VirB9
MMALGGCASAVPTTETFTPATHVIEKPIFIHPPTLKMDYQLTNQSNPTLEHAYQQYLHTGNAPNIVTPDLEQFAYNIAFEPLIAASPLLMTIISLEPGENVTNVSSGDPLRWSYSMAYSGKGDLRQAQILVKPSFPNISTNFAITTDKRLYKLKIVSKQNGEDVRNVSFWYPDEIQAFWDNVNKAQSQQVEKGDTITDFPNLDVNHLNFNYRIKPACGWFHSAPRWTPVRVFDDGTHTYIQFPAIVYHRDLPVLFVLNGHTEELVNYRSKPPYFVVDKVFQQAVLVLGVGSQQAKVTLTNHQY